MIQDPEPVTAMVALDDPVYGDKVTVTIESTNKKISEGLGYLRTMEWAKAEDSFRAVTETERNNEKLAEAYFGLGVSLEAQKEYQGALDAYNEAFRRVNTVPYENGVTRARTALGLPTD